MRYIIFFLTLWIFNTNNYAQNITPYDLYLVKENKEIDLIHHFLVNCKDFNYDGIVRKTNEGNDVYRFSKGVNFIEVYFILSIENNLIFPVVSYYIYSKEEFNNFSKSLIFQNFVVQSEGIPKDNSIDQYYWIYRHKLAIRILRINFQTSHYMIQIT